MNTVSTEAEKKEILRAIGELETRENRKDIKGILDLLSEDFVFISGNRMCEGKQETEKMLREAMKNYISSKHIPLRVEVSSSGDIAWLLGYEFNKRERSDGIVETNNPTLFHLERSKVNGKKLLFD